MIFPSLDLWLPEEDRKPFFLETLNIVNVIYKRSLNSKKLNTQT
jgi:hypothetical protein